MGSQGDGSSHAELHMSSYLFRFAMRVLSVLLTVAVHGMALQPSCTGESCPEIAGMAEIVTDVVLNVMSQKTGKRTKKRLSVQRHEDPGSVATRFCQMYAISVDQ